MNITNWLWIILLGIIWGFSFPFNAILLVELSPLWISALRVGIGALGCWVILFALKKTMPTDLTLLIKIIILGIITYAIPFALFPIAQIHLSSGVASIINAMTPITTVIVSHIWINGERATWSKALGVGAGFAGAAFLAIPALQSGGNSQLWAMVLAFMATIIYAASLNYTRINLPKTDPTALAAIALSGASIAAIPIALIFDGVPSVTKLETWVSLLGIGLVATAFAFQVMYRLLPKVGATNFSVTTFIAPISAIILGASLLGERLQISHFIGMAFIFFGLLLIDGRILKRLKHGKMNKSP
ncbi:MAG: DMT family transporter [Devosiaceae bacterium]|nr:DMT family transporter [Devosiaceae bacterium]